MAAKLLFDNENYRIANNRAYYSIFHALRAVLVFDNFDSSKHSGVI
ncbi:MAG: HEPN domain-containing protein, partial [Eubacterium sp.]|nr:HEPN domain-containing protein [Eubacterium sp.]